MAAAVGRETDAVAFFAALAKAPYEYDFCQTMRWIECLYADKPRWGTALRPADEGVRLGQDPYLAFAPAALSSFTPEGDDRAARLQVRLFGLFGPNGPLPTHITEFAYERLHQHGDPTLSRFLDMFHHRFLALFYRAWAQAQPHVSHDRPDDRFALYVGAFTGLAPEGMRHRDAVPDAAKLLHMGALIRQVRNADGLVAILRQFFGVPAEVEEFVGRWLLLDARDETRLGRDESTLGLGAVLGDRVWDRQHTFRIRLGPLTLEQFEAFLPGGRSLEQLVDWVRMYLCFELGWDVQLILGRRDVSGLSLGAGGRLGWTTWLGRRAEATDAGDLCLNAEAFVPSREHGAA